MDYLQYKNYLMHYGVKGQKWGVRRYQNKDGTLTDAGKERYYNESEQEQLFRDSKQNVNNKNLYKMPIDFSIKNVDDITEAGKFLAKQRDVITDDFTKYCASYEKDISGLRNNKQFVNDVKKTMNDMFGGPDQVDDPEFAELEIYDVCRDVATKYYSDKTKNHFSRFEANVNQYYDNVKNITNDIVGKHGDEPISNIVNSTSMFRQSKTPVSYKDVVTNTLHETANSAWVRYMYNHTEVADENVDWDSISLSIYDEWSKGK